MKIIFIILIALVTSSTLYSCSPERVASSDILQNGVGEYGNDPNGNEEDAD
jgi:hypothetical protein